MPTPTNSTPANPATGIRTQNPLDAEWKPVARDDVVFRQLADEWVLFDADSNQIHVLNMTAARVWLECDGTRTAAAIAQELRADFEEAPSAETVQADVVATLTDFADRGLVS